MLYTGGQKLGLLTLISFSLKIKLNDKCKNLSLVKFGVLDNKKRTNMIQHHVHIRSTDHFKQVVVRENMTEMRSIVCMTIAFCSTLA